MSAYAHEQLRYDYGADGLDSPARSGLRWWLWALLWLLLVTISTPIGVAAWYERAYTDRVFRGVSALGVDLSGMTSAEARRVLEDRAASLSVRPVVITAGERQWRTDWSRLGLAMPIAPLVEQAMAVGRQGGELDRAIAQLETLQYGASTPTIETFDAAVVRTFVQQAVSLVERPVRNSRLELKDDLSLEFTPAQTGYRLDGEEAVRRLLAGAETGVERVDLPIRVIEPTTTDAMRLPARRTIERLIAAPLVLSYEDKSWTIERREIADMLRFSGGPGMPIQVSVDTAPLTPRVEAIARELNQRAKDAKIGWDPAAGAVRSVVPSEDGREVDVASAVRMLTERLERADRAIPLPVSVTKPTIDSANLDKLGVRELVDKASTSFAGALPQKEHNVRLAASRLDGQLLPPRATFSFNKSLGPTTIENGYQVAFGITSDGTNTPKTVPSVAGGICQVATTLFQPVFWSGYQVEERHWHLYWIPAYASRGVVGLDATVDEEAGLDLRFTNNSDSYLLIQARTDATTVTFELFGTKPAWDVRVDGPVVSERKPPGDTAPVYEPEAMLAEGRQYQIESARDGFVATFVRTVSEGGTPRSLKLESHYVPSRNVVLVGTGGKPATPRGDQPDTNRAADARPRV